MTEKETNALESAVREILQAPVEALQQARDDGHSGYRHALVLIGALTEVVYFLAGKIESEVTLVNKNLQTLKRVDDATIETLGSVVATIQKLTK